jgi:hypothetical protein
LKIFSNLTRWAGGRICTLTSATILAGALIFASIFARSAIILCHPIKLEEKIGVRI